MGSPLGPTLGNIFRCNHKTMWLKKFWKSLKPVYYKKYVHDIFVLFNKLNKFYDLYLQMGKMFCSFPQTVYF